MSERRIRVLLVDDNPDFLRSAARTLSALEGLDIVGQALSGHQALQVLSEAAPDCVLVDIAMPVMDGLELTRRIKEINSATTVVVVTLHDDPEYREAAVAAGADGLIPKERWGRDVLPLLERMRP